MVNTDTQRIITGEVGTVISVISDRAYTVSVMAVVNDSQRSEPDRESITAGGEERIAKNVLYVVKFRFQHSLQYEKAVRCGPV